MNYLKVTGVPFTFAGRTFDLVFNVNVMAEIYAKYKSTKAFMEEYNSAIKDEESPMRLTSLLTWLFCILVNDAIATENERSAEKTEKITERQAGHLLKVKDFQALQPAILMAWHESMPEPEEQDEDDEPTPAEEEAEKN